jgi:nitrate/nitrite transport system substrate-binding protein
MKKTRSPETLSPKGESRRQALKTTAGVAATAALLSAARAAFPGGAFAQAKGIETKKATLGFIALMDACPLFAAKEKGIFDKYGLTEVEIAKQASWPATRDNIVLGGDAGGIDGAHILTPLPYLISTGRVTTNNQPVPMYILERLNLDGQGISVAASYKDMKIGLDSSPLKAKYQEMIKAGKEVKAAMTFPGGTHDMWMRYWLAAGGIEPDKDIQIIPVPPPQMVANMKVGTMETFCVAEPWHLQLLHQGLGYTALTTGELWNKHPEKALGLRADWVDKNPKAAQALLMAVMEGQQWCEDPANTEEMCKIASKRNWINAPFEDIIDRAKGNIDYGSGRVVENSPHKMKFWKDNASYPYKSHDLWFLTENQRWGYLPTDLDTKSLIDKVNREDLWREAAKALGVTDIPTSTSRGKETFFDGKVFDPENPKAYLASLAIKKMA